MCNIKYTKNFVMIQNFLTNDEKKKLMRMNGDQEIIQFGKTFDEYDVDFEKKNFMVALFKKFLKIVRETTDVFSYPYNLCKKVRKLFRNEKKLEMIRLHFKPIFDSHAIHYHYDSWSNWNFICSIGGPSVTKLKNTECIMNDGSAYLFNGSTEIHAVELLKDGKFLRLSRSNETYRQCFQLRRYERNSYLREYHTELGNNKYAEKYTKICEERKLKLRAKASLFRKSLQ